MIMEALTGLKTELMAKIDAINTRVDTATLPSSKPFADYGDFSLREPQDTWFNGNPDPAPEAAMHAAEDANLIAYNAGLDRRKVYDSIANELIDRKVIMPMSDEAHLERFHNVCEKLFSAMNWFTTDPITEDQRTTILASWRRAEAEEDVFNYKYSTRHIYHRISGRKFDSDHDNFNDFTMNFNAFCAENNIDPNQGFPEEHDIFFRSFCRI